MAFGTDHTIGYLWSEILDERIARKRGGQRADRQDYLLRTPTRVQYDPDSPTYVMPTVQTIQYFAQNRLTPGADVTAGDTCITDPKSLACDLQYSQKEHQKPSCGRSNCGGETTRVPTDSVLK